MIKLSSLVLLGMLTTISVFSQSPVSKTVNQSIEWSSINSTIKVHKKIGIYVEGNFRFAQNLQPQQNQFRTGVEFSLSKRFYFIPLGYVYTWNYQYGKQPVSIVDNEHRIYQQIVYKNAIGRVFMQNRLRLEERFLQDRHILNDGDITGNGYTDDRYRMRYRGMINVPLNHPKIEANTWFVSVWDELFISWGKKVTYHLPDQNRLFAGMGYQFNKLTSVQFGGIYQMLKKSNNAQQENNYGGMIQLTYNFDFTKAK